MKRLRQLKKWLKKILNIVRPSKTALRGASISLIVVSSIIYLLYAIYGLAGANDPWFSILFILLVLASGGGAFLSLWVLKKIHQTPRNLKFAFLFSIPLFLSAFAFEGLYVASALLIFSFLGAAIALFIKGKFRYLTKIKKTLTILGLLIGLIGLTGSIVAYIPTGFEMKPPVNAANLNSNAIVPIAAPSPSLPGQYKVKTLTYGSGKDKHRSEFSDQVTIITDAVNGNPFLDNWEGISGWYREKYWGFNAKSLPVNGYVWHPEGDGPFPLALIVHGNHLMSDFSDTGYAYLGELLASRGIIVASVDENFLNGSWSDIPEGLDEENDARGWMLLEHLKVWHQWNNDPNSLFYKKIDTSNIALMGHSRGGEAVGHAAFLNKLPYYSDDASIPLNYNHNIKSIVAIAPVDRQYKPGNAPNKIKDVSYFTIHGSQDGDVSSFAGSQQYERVTFSDSTNYFKSGLYIQGANHGQFNASWGVNDIGLAATKFLNNAQLLSKEQQEEIAKIYISAFLETTLKGNREYRSLFADARKGKNWLPETIYLNQYEDASFNALATYEEDFNVLTANDTSTTITTQNLSVWREQEINLKWGKKGSSAVYIGWHYDKLEEDQAIPDSIKASYSFHFNQIPTKIDSTRVLTFSLAESTENTHPKSSGKWINTSSENENDKIQNKASEKDTHKEENSKEDTNTADDIAKAPIDFTIKLKDAAANEVVFCLSDFSALQREIKVRIWKSQFITSDSSSENIFQTFVFPLEKITEVNPDFDTMNLRSIHFIFDKTSEGVIILDNMGFMQSFEI